MMHLIVIQNTVQKNICSDLLYLLADYAHLQSKKMESLIAEAGGDY